MVRPGAAGSSSSSKRDPTPAPAAARGESAWKARRRLMWHGMCLFLLGLFTGFAEQQFANARMGLAAHLEGVMNWHLPPCPRSRLVQPKTLARLHLDRVLGRSIRHLRQLVHHSPRCCLRNSSPLSHHRRRPLWPALAGKACYARIPVRRRSRRRRLRAGIVGSPL